MPLSVLWSCFACRWKSGRQSLIAASTAEAELIGASNAGEALKATHLIVHELLGTSESTKNMAGRVWCDNQSSIAQVVKDAASNLRTRHLSIRAHRLAADIKAKYLELAYVETTAQRADCLTKAYPKPLMLR